MKTSTHRIPRVALLAALFVGGATLRAQAVVPPSPTGRASTLDFVNTKVADVVRTLASMLGRTVIINDVADTRVTFSTANTLKTAELESLLESILEAHDLQLVSKGTVWHVMPNATAPSKCSRRQII